MFDSRVGWGVCDKFGIVFPRGMKIIDGTIFEIETSRNFVEMACY